MPIEITNIEEFKKELNSYIAKKFKIAGFLIEKEIRREIEKMKLLGNPAVLWQKGYSSYVEQSGLNTSLVIETGLPYAVYLEYGTYSYFDRYGMMGFPKTPLRKKKDSTPNQRRKMIKGMQPFAPIRRVLWNPQTMGNILRNSFK